MSRITLFTVMASSNITMEYKPGKQGKPVTLVVSHFFKPVIEVPEDLVCGRLLSVLKSVSNSYPGIPFGSASAVKGPLPPLPTYSELEAFCVLHHIEVPRDLTFERRINFVQEAMAEKYNRPTVIDVDKPITPRELAKLLSDGHALSEPLCFEERNQFKVLRDIFKQAESKDTPVDEEASRRHQVIKGSQPFKANTPVKTNDYIAVNPYKGSRNQSPDKSPRSTAARDPPFAGISHEVDLQDLFKFAAAHTTEAGYRSPELDQRPEGLDDCQVSKPLEGVAPLRDTLNAAMTPGAHEAFDLKPYGLNSYRYTPVYGQLVKFNKERAHKRFKTKGLDRDQALAVVLGQGPYLLTETDGALTLDSVALNAA